MKLTEKTVAAAPLPAPPRTQTFYFDDRLTGFGLCVSTSGRHSFVVQARVRRANRVRRVVLGQWPAMSVEAARAAARPLLAALGAGHDPVAERKAAPAVPTLGAFIPRYIEHAKAHKRSWRKDEVELRRYLPAEWRERALDAFTPGDMVALHTRLGARGHYAANGFLRTLRAMFNRARDWGALPENHLNPCRKVQWFKEQARERYLSLEEHDQLQAALDAEPDALWRDFFRLCLLTAQRKMEVAGMQWSEIDLDAAIWTVPAERTKAKRLTRVPLTEQATAILRARRAAAGDNPYVFPSPWKCGRAAVVEPKGAWNRILDRAGLPHDLRIHDLRRTTASLAAAAGVSLAVIGKLLNHSRSTTTEIYAKLNLDPVRAALQAQHDALDARRNGHTVNGGLRTDLN